MTRIISKRLLLLSTIFLLSACGSPKRLIQLEDAREFYNSVSRDPLVARNAALELDDAKKSLEKAHKLWEEGEKKGLVEHYAHLTDQQVAIAQYRARLIEYENRLARLTSEYQQVQLAANERGILESKRLAMAEETQAQEIVEKVAQLEQQMIEVEASQSDRGLVLTLGHELFADDSANLNPEAVEKVGKVAGLIKEYPEQSVLIEGHTDTFGDDNYNQELSARRAESVKLALVSEGVAEERVVTRGLGESSPKMVYPVGMARLVNPRVEIIFEKSLDINASHRLVALH